MIRSYAAVIGFNMPVSVEEMTILPEDLVMETFVPASTLSSRYPAVSVPSVNTLWSPVWVGMSSQLGPDEPAVRTCPVVPIPRRPAAPLAPPVIMSPCVVIGFNIPVSVEDMTILPDDFVIDTFVPASILSSRYPAASVPSVETL